MKEKIEAMYLDYFNNFLTVERFADYYNLNVVQALRLLAIGRKLNDKWSKT